LIRKYTAVDTSTLISVVGNITSNFDLGSYTYAGNTGSSYANPDAFTSIGGAVRRLATRPPRHCARPVA
jgi:hypothetical protein